MFKFIEVSQKVILCINKTYSFLEFCNILKVKPDLFASLILRQVYREVFIQSDNLKLLFNKFYIAEYLNFQDYLVRNYDIDIPELDEKKEFIFLIKPEYILINPNYSKNHLEEILNIIIKNE